MDAWRFRTARDLGLGRLQRYRCLGRESGLWESGVRWIWWSAVKSVVSLSHQLEIHGRDNLPIQPPFVLVANHASHLDALVLASAVPLRYRDQLFLIAAGDYFFEGALKTIFSATALNALPIWRGRRCGARALADLRRRLVEDGAIYVIFPEGRRSRDGQVHAFKPGFAALVAGSHVPIVPSYLYGTFEALPPRARVPKFVRIGLELGRPRLFEEVANTREGWNRITADTKAAVHELGRKAGVRACPAPSTAWAGAWPLMY